jgi:hypothetical protein
VPRQTFPRDRFDERERVSGRVGAHRAENPRMRAGVVLLWAIVATIVLIGLGIFGSLIASGRITLFPTASPTAEPTIEVTPIVDTSYTVLVLNATDEQGLATRTKDTLLAQGWSEQDVTAGSAGGTFETTTVYYASDAAYPAALGLADLVGATEVQYDPDYPLPGTVARQLTVVLGTGQLPSATPTS